MTCYSSHVGKMVGQAVEVLVQVVCFWDCLVIGDVAAEVQCAKVVARGVVARMAH